MGLVQDVVDTHPGLTFLKEAQEFHSRYVHTVSPVLLLELPNLVLYLFILFLKLENSNITGGFGCPPLEIFEN